MEKPVFGGKRVRLTALLTLLSLLAAACGSAGSTTKPAAAAAPVKSSSAGAPAAAAGKSAPIEIGVLVPLTGPNAQIGAMEKLGAQIAVNEINAHGGVKALGGAPLKLVVQDSDQQVSAAVSGMESLLATHHIVAGIGPGISSPAMAASEVSEQKQVPWVDLSFNDKLTERGFKYLFITSPKQSSFDARTYPAVEQLAKEAGVTLKRVGLMYSPNVTTSLGAKHIEQIYAPKFGWKTVLNKQVTQGSVTGAFLNTIVTEIKQTRPQVMFLGSSAPDVVNVQRQEIAEGMTPVPWVLNGAPYLTTGFLSALGPKGTQGLIASASAGVDAANAALAKKIRSMGQVAEEHDLATYSEIYIILDAINAAKSTNHTKVRNALAHLDLKGGPAAEAWPCDCLKFDSTGRASTATSILVQWQNGVPQTVYPSSIATAKPYWPK